MLYKSATNNFGVRFFINNIFVAAVASHTKTNKYNQKYDYRGVLLLCLLLYNTKIMPNNELLFLFYLYEMKLKLMLFYLTLCEI